MLRYAWFAFFGITVAVVLGGCGDDQTLSCGPGTVEQNGQCLPTPPGEAPTVDSIDPASGALVGGGGSFTITGANFQANGAGDTTVLFGDSPAAFEITSDTEITGTIPRALYRDVSVTVQNQNGAASVDFSYTGIYGADGKKGVAGNLYLIDPRNGYSIEIGPIQSGDPGAVVGHAVSGMAFDASGTLWAATAVGTGNSQLLTVDPSSGVATVVADLTPAAGTVRHIADLTFSGNTLIGWWQVKNTPGEAATIATDTGDVTLLGPTFTGSYGNGLVTLGDGRVVLFPRGVGGGRGDYYEVAPDTGARTQMGTLDADGNPGLCGATMFRGTLYGIVCPYFGLNGGTVLVTIDPDAGTVTAVSSAPLNLDAIASDEPTAAAAVRISLQPVVPDQLRATAMLAAGSGCQRSEAGMLRVVSSSGTQRILAGADLGTMQDSVAVDSTYRAAQGLPLALVTPGTVEVSTCDGSSMSLAATDIDRYVLMQNRRGLIKLVDLQTGTPVARGVVEIKAAR